MFHIHLLSRDFPALPVSCALCSAFQWLFIMKFFFFFFFVGGTFGLFDGRIDSLLTSSQGTQCNNEILCWGDINDPLPF